MFGAETCSAASSTSTNPQRDNRRSGFRHPQAATPNRNWLAVLTATLAAFYVFLGATALGLAGVLGILILAAFPRRPGSRRLSSSRSGPASTTDWVAFRPRREVRGLARDLPVTRFGPALPEHSASPEGVYPRGRCAIPPQLDRARRTSRLSRPGGDAPRQNDHGSSFHIAATHAGRVPAHD
jgi:hypothetical protein